MKLNKWMFGVLATALFAACSDDREITPTPPEEVVGSEGFISISIGLPTEPISRANDQFNDGEQREYAVNRVAILFFQGPTEEGAKFYKAYNVTNTWNENDKNDTNPQITSEKAVTFPVDFAKDATDKLWALAMVNYGGILTLTDLGTDSDGKKLGSSVKIGDTSITVDKTIEDIMKLTTDKLLYSIDDDSKKETNFFMTNSPYSRVEGGITMPTFTEGGSNYFRVLADVDRAKIFKTEKEAKENPAAEIFVERALAKVEVFATLSDLNDNLTPGISIKSIKWVIDNTEPSSYIVRNLETIGKTYDITHTPSWATYMNTIGTTRNYRFIGSVPLKDRARYRTYFCTDPNGEGLAETGGKKLKSTDLANLKEISNSKESNPQYCYENTFSVEYMDYFNTTRAIIEVTYQDGKGNIPTFYTIGLDNKHQFTFDNAASHLATEVILNSTIRDAWENYFKKLNQEYHNNATTLNLAYNSENLTAENEWMKLQFSLNNARLTIETITLYDGEKNNINAGDLKDAIKEINGTLDIKAYQNGKSYYAVRIKHFGDDLTYWDTDEETTLTTTDSYGDVNSESTKANYLGRYGVVRNNWYQITINSINNFGEPSYADLPLDHTPDDKVVKEESISCKVNILSWALRRQTVDL